MMPADDTPFDATDDSSLVAVRALTGSLESQHESVEVTAWALLAELDAHSVSLGQEYQLLTSADVNFDSFHKYPCIGHVIENTGYTANIFVQILRDLNKLKLRISPEDIGRSSIVSARALTFAAFDIVEMYSMQSADGRYETPQWAVRLGQWATWLLTAEARRVLGRIAHAALSLDDHECFRIAVKLGQYSYFVLHAADRPHETRVPLMNILAEVSDLSVLEMRDRQHEAQLSEILRKFELASNALAAEGVCSIRLLRAGSDDTGGRVAHNDNQALLSNSIVTISASA